MLTRSVGEFLAYGDTVGAIQCSSRLRCGLGCGETQTCRLLAETYRQHLVRAMCLLSAKRRLPSADKMEWVQAIV